MKRHDLIFVDPTAWHLLLEKHSELAADPLVASWADRGWPLVGRRAMCSEFYGVPLGLPLPPFAGKRRLSFLMQPEEIRGTAPPPTLRVAGLVAPQAWRPTLDKLDEFISQHSVDARVFGSLAWRELTGLDYLTARSDLDLLLNVGRDVDLLDLAAGLAAIEAAAPMRLDGEFVREDGAAVNWRELHAGAPEVLVKTLGGVRLLGSNLFLTGMVAS